MTSDAIIDGILQREGGWRDAKERPDHTIDPPTHFGITLTTLDQWWREQGLTAHPTEQDLRQIDQADAAAIYVWLYMDQPGFTMGNIPFEPLRVQMIDFGVNSSPARAVRWLQRTLGYTGAQITGNIDEQTIYSLKTLDGTWYAGLLNDALVAARCEMIREAIAAGKIDRSDELGLLRRAISFTLTTS